jgi:hypothetical protein
MSCQVLQDMSVWVSLCPADVDRPPGAHRIRRCVLLCHYLSPPNQGLTARGVLSLQKTNLACVLNLCLLLRYGNSRCCQT